MKVYTTEIVVNAVQFLDTKKAAANLAGFDEIEDEQIPF